MKKVLLLFLALCLSISALAGCGSGTSSELSGQEESYGASVDPTHINPGTAFPTQQGLHEATLGTDLSKAMELFKKQYPDAKPIRISLSVNANNYLWEIQGHNGEELDLMELDANTGEVLRSSAEKLEPDQSQLFSKMVFDTTGLSDMKAAINTAYAKEKGNVRRVSLEYAHNKLLYIVEIEASAGLHFLYVDAKTGEWFDAPY